MGYQLPPTLVRIGRINFPLDRAVTMFREQLEPVTLGLGNTVKYCRFNKTEPHYLLMVSQQKDRIVSAAGHNTMLTVTSRSDATNREVAARFERETDMKLDLKVPGYLIGQSNLFGLSYIVLEAKPDEAIAFLAGRL